MKQLLGFPIALWLILPIATALADSNENYLSNNRYANRAQLEANKQVAMGFYQDLWATNNTDRYSDYVADSYVVHDIGDRKGVTEPAIEQKLIADRFWDGGDMSFELDYQIAEGDLVATRWTWHYEPETLLSRFMFGSNSIPIINVFRIKDGRIVEVWNHRHDIDTNITNLYLIQGLLIGLLIALIPTVMVFRLRRKLKRSQAG